MYPMDSHNNSTCVDQQQNDVSKLVFYAQSASAVTSGQNKFMKVRCILWTAIITVPALISSRKMKVRCINYYIF